MKLKEITEKIKTDLIIPEHRARAYAKMFDDKFNGNIRAITYILASYTESGDIRVSYVIENKRNYLTIDGSKPFSKKIKKDE